MRGRGYKVEGSIVAAVAIVIVLSAIGGVAAAVEPQRPGPALAKGQYKFAPGQLAGLPSALALEKLEPEPGNSPTRPGVQTFRSPLGVYGMSLLTSPQPPGARLLFQVSGLWTFLHDRRFEQRDAKGNRLIIEDGKAQVFNRAGAQIGALQDPGLGVLYKALLRLTM